MDFNEQDFDEINYSKLKKYEELFKIVDAELKEKKKKYEYSKALYQKSKIEYETIQIEHETLKRLFKTNLELHRKSMNITILDNWLRIYSLSVDGKIIKLILKYMEYELSVRLTRPVSLHITGGGNDHYLCIRQIQVYSISGKLIKLKFKDGSRCIKRGSNGRTPLKCIDGDLSGDSVNCPDYSNIQENNSETHWMEFIIDNKGEDIDKIKIYNRLNYKHRIKGVIVNLCKDGNVFQSWTIQQTQNEYEFGL